MKRMALGLVVCVFALTGCSKITMLRTEEMKSVGEGVQGSIQVSLDSSVQALSAQNDSLRARIDSLNAQLETQALIQKRMQAEVTMLSRRMGDESERNDSRQEEIIYRLDMLLGKSDKILAKKVVISGVPTAPMSMDSLEQEAEKLVEAEAMFNTARSDYHRGEYKLAFTGFKQVYEQMKSGELAEGSLYWMGLCLEEVNQMAKAKKVLTNLYESFPNSSKVCPAIFKLANIYGDECDIDMQKQNLQKLLSTKSCEQSSEFEQAAEMLQEILEREDKVKNGDSVEACVPKVYVPPETQADSTQAAVTTNAAAPADSSAMAPAMATPAEPAPTQTPVAPADSSAAVPAKP